MVIVLSPSEMLYGDTWTMYVACEARRRNVIIRIFNFHSLSLINHHPAKKMREPKMSWITEDTLEERNDMSEKKESWLKTFLRGWTNFSVERIFHLENIEKRDHQEEVELSHNKFKFILDSFWLVNSSI
ncbi:unnamed protein product [Acanthoscelides obtectus]|uniref:Uncharacterized protein n=1 Tax=Acanthoscelides obtectus TaxID=200917 RepID=A0A9P0LZD3_ACAOB|nr:unnamed protein product [Acanthoscelides obtectus]CAK1648531.1 hypothetical protein AOBTE_LOCUS15746 [Acanthoscelides obtectus]